ncbi:MAG: hypothetical protein KDC44_04915 [Phaeodactylibacter sp.]|nr:hypothetical protein [Phaeodactylibacter sp.]
MKSVFSFLLAQLIMLTGLMAQDPLWGLSYGSSGFDYIADMIVDHAGDIIVTGHFTGDLVIDGTTVNQVDGDEVYILKTDAAGNLLWYHTFLGTGTDRPGGLAVDASNNIFLAGYFYDDLDVDGQSLMSQGNADAYLLKIAPNGNIVATLPISSPDQVRAGAIYHTGDELLIAGSFRSSLTLGGTTLESNGETDIFLAAMNPNNGSINWARSFGGAGYDWFGKIEKSPSGAIYAVGRLGDDAYLGNLEANVVVGSEAFALKMDATGEPQWVVMLEGEGASDDAFDLALDADENLYIAGKASDDLMVFSTEYLYNFGAEGYLLSLNKDGDFRWMQMTYTEGTSIFFGVVLNSAQNRVYAAGSVHDGAAFNGSHEFTGIEDVGLGIVTFDTEGTYLESVVLDGPGFDYAAALATDGTDLYVGGTYGEGFAPANLGTYGSEGQTDCFVGRLDVEAVPNNLSEAVSPVALMHWNMHQQELQITLSEEGPADVQIWSMTGTLLANRSFRREMNWTLALPVGLYAVTVESVSGSYTKLIQVLR